MKKEIDIHGYSRRLELGIKLVEKSNISKKNKKLIFDFKDYAKVEAGLGTPRIARYMGILKDWALILKKDFDKCTKEDIVKAVSKIQDKENYTAWTKATYKIMLKRFFRWLKNTGNKQPEETEWIQTVIKRTDKKMISNSELLTEQEIQNIIDTATNIRDKALVSLLYESGARIGEIGSLQICNVSFDKHGALINVEGKTGARPIRIISSTAYITTWIQNHPQKNNPQAPLWINIGTTNHHKPLKYDNIRTILRNLFKKAKINKRFNPHMFRHSRATFLADYLTEFQMNQYFGWIQGSKMPAVYVHMSGKKIDSSILALNGIKQPQKKSETLMKPRICPRCDTINTPDAKFCTKCAGILDVQVAMQMEDKISKEKEMRTRSDDLMNMLMKDKEFFSMFVEKVKELNKGIVN